MKKMALSKINPSQTQVWDKLSKHYNDSKEIHLRELFTADEARADKFTIKWNDFLFDYSKNRITSKTV